jgi:hypothetical protein
MADTILVFHTQEGGMVKRAGGSLLLSVKIDRDAHQPVSTQLCIALREMILTGGFLRGTWACRAPR